jgi:hypothetical protein
MKPRHFWWLVETLSEQDAKPSKSMSKDDRAELLALLERAEDGDM